MHQGSALAVILCCTGLSALADTVLQDLRWPGMQVRIVDIPAADVFTLSKMEARARTDLQRASNLRFGLTRYYCCGRTPLPKPSHTGYNNWRSTWDILSGQQRPQAEIIAINGNAVLRVRDAAGKISTKALAGSNPLIVELGPRTYTIGHIAVPESAASFQNIYVYLQTEGALSEEDGLELYKRFVRVFSGLDVSVFVRNDMWFIRQMTFPFVIPYSADMNPPTLAEYTASKTLECSRVGGSASCSIW